jgi:hypothetical protein
MNPYRRDTLLNGMLGEENRFIGLRDELEWVLAHVSAARPAAVSLVGPIGVGKSFLLMYLAHQRGARRSFRHAIGQLFADDPERLVFVQLDLEDRASGSRAAPHLIELLYQETLERLTDLLGIGDARLLPLDALPAERARTLPELRAQAQKQLARAREEADDGELRERFDEALGGTPHEALYTLLGYLETWGLRVIFLIDDFDTITSLLDRADFDQLRTLLARASLVIVTRKALSKLVPAEVQTSPFFNLVQRLDLRSLYFWPVEEAKRMITEPPKWIKDAPIQFSPSDVKFILGLTGLQPDLIQRSCEELYMRNARRSIPPGADVLSPSEHQLIRAQLGALFADSFAALWHRLSQGERDTLGEIAAGKVTVDNTLTVPLNAVINRGYVECEQGRYRLFSLLFQDYVAEKAGITPVQEPLPVRAQLTELEQKLLEILRTHQGDIVDREEIVAALYPEAKTANGNARLYQSRLDALIFRLRGKLDGEPQQIESIRGQGYRLVTAKS